MDIHDSKLSLHVGNEEMIFRVEDGLKKDKAQNEVFYMDKIMNLRSKKN